MLVASVCAPAEATRWLKLALHGIRSLKVGQLYPNPWALRGVHKREAANYGDDLLKCKKKKKKKTVSEMSLVQRENVYDRATTDVVKVTETVCYSSAYRQFI